MKIILFVVLLQLNAHASIEKLQNSYAVSIQKAQSKHEIEYLNQQIFKSKSFFYLCEQEIAHQYYPVNCFRLNLLSLKLGWVNKYTTHKFVDYLNSFCINKARNLKARADLLLNMHPACSKRLLHQHELNKYKNEFEW